MDPIVQTLLSWQFIVFGVAVAAVMFVIRKIVEYLLVNVTSVGKEAKLWNDLILPILPVIIGSVGAIFFKTFPYPDNLITKGNRFVFGLVAGLLSTLMYRVVKSFFYQKIAEASNNTNTNTTVEKIPEDQMSSRGQP